MRQKRKGGRESQSGVQQKRRLLKLKGQKKPKKTGLSIQKGVNNLSFPTNLIYFLGFSCIL